MDPSTIDPQLQDSTPTPIDPEDTRDLERDRRENDLRLKSAFETIFAKYSKDFTNTGDEIDLETGEIIVDNGHIHSMRDETDVGEQGDAGRMLRSFSVAPAELITIESDTEDDEDELSMDVCGSQLARR